MKKKLTIMTITGIRPDFIRMSAVFKELDAHFNHIMVHTGQHYDDELSNIFFKDLSIRKPDHTLNTGISSKTHYEQLSYLSKEIFYLINKCNINPDLILFLGDSNSALVSIPLFKEGYRIGHIEGGMRSYDRRMPEEVNRVTCDYVSDLIFVYTPLYKQRLLSEGKSPDNVFVVGNTITEIVNNHLPYLVSSNEKNYILADIHRNENLKTAEQLRHILSFLNLMAVKTNKKIKLVKFNRALKMIESHNLLSDLSNIELVGPYGFLEYLSLQKNAFAVVSDSGTAQEECPLLKVPVVVPRKSTERPESMETGCSILVGEDRPIEEMTKDSINFINNYRWSEQSIHWLGEGKTSKMITQILESKL